MMQMYNKKQKKILQSNFTAKDGTRIWKAEMESSLFL